MPTAIIAAASIATVVYITAAYYALLIAGRSFVFFLRCLDVRFRQKDMGLCTCVMCVEIPMIFCARPRHIAPKDEHLLKY